MKKLNLAARVLLIAISAVCLASCGSGDKNDAPDSLKDVKGAQKGDAFDAQTNIRYIDMDTVMEHYQYAVDQRAVVQQIDLELQQYQAQLGRTLQNKQAAIQQKVQSNGYLSEASYNADMQDLARLNQQSEQQYGTRAEADMKRVAEINAALVKAVDDYIIEYNKDKKYDAILYKSAGIYFNPALDITNEILTGLNAKYKATKADAPKADAKADEKK